MSGWELAIAAGSLLGKLLEWLVRAAIWAVIALVVVALFLGAAVFGATRTGRQLEYRTRPE